MRVLLCSANRERFPEPVFPVGPAYVSSALVEAGAAVRICDAGSARFPSQALARAIGDFQPDVVGLSLRNVDNAAWPCTVSYIDGYRRITRRLRTLTDAPLLLGGAAFSIFPRELQDLLNADGGVAGDGERAVDFILGEEVRRGAIENARLESLDGVGLPDSLGQIFPSVRNYGAYGIQTARGCPHRCLYCTYPLLEGRRLRTREAQAVLRDVHLLRSAAGAAEFFIVDSTFNASEEHMAEVLDALRSARRGIRFSCYMTPKVSDPGVFGLLAEAGCIGVDFGTDSGSPQVLSSLNKGFSVEDVRKASTWCRRAGIDYCHSLLFGGPGETASTVRETVALMDEVSPRAVIAMAGMRILPGTDLEKLARKERALGEASLLEPRFYFAGDAPGDLYGQVAAAASARKNWFLPGKRYWSSSLLPWVFRLLRRGGGPLWRRL